MRFKQSNLHVVGSKTLTNYRNNTYNAIVERMLLALLVGYEQVGLTVRPLKKRLWVVIIIGTYVKHNNLVSV